MRMTNKLRLIATTSLTLTLTALAAQSAAAQDALPTGGAVTSGSATIGGQIGSGMTINQSSQRAVIDWASFNVGQPNTLNFAHASADGATLNRVTGGTASTIAGQINANGSVYLINPNGIQITKSGVINAGRGFVASTLDISNTDFMAGSGRFTGTGGLIDHQGVITVGTGGVVGLLGGSINSSGLILASAGQVVIGAVSHATLDLNGGGFLQVALPDHSALAQNGSSAIVSAQTSYDATRNSINLDGFSATGVTGRNGDIVLTGNINVDSIVGDAGSIMVMGNDTRVSGQLSARATGLNGNGGLIETSGNFVDFTGVSVDTRATHGATGTWLVDPTDLIIGATEAAVIQGNLATTNVTLQTFPLGDPGGPGVHKDGTGDISILAPISWSANTLTLHAYNSINVHALLTASGNAGLALNYGDSLGSSSRPPRVGAGMEFGLSDAGFKGRIDFTGANNSLSINGNNYTIITALGAQGSMTGKDLQGINGGLGDYYALGADIDASATRNWNNGAGFDPLGGVNYFYGSFTGLGHTISNLWIDRRSAYVGLFSRVSGQSTIGHVGLVNAAVSANGSAGVFNPVMPSAGGNGGVAGTLAGSSAGVITQSYATGSVSANGGKGGDAVLVPGGIGGQGGTVGGLVGDSSATITQSHAMVSVSANGGQGGSSTMYYGRDGSGGTVGGLVGRSTGNVQQSYATGSVSANGALVNGSTGGTAGGLIGQSYGAIIQSYATGSVSANGGIANRNLDSVSQFQPGLGGTAGGLAGVSQGAITQSYATGSVSANGGALTIYAGEGGGKGGTAGGLVGNSTSTIDQSYATGSVSANGAPGLGEAAGAGAGAGGTAGGLVGRNEGVISQSYATGATSADAGNDSVTAGAAGGLIGRSYGHVVQNYATGRVSARGYDGMVGGLVGQAGAGTIGASYWDTYTSGRTNAVGTATGTNLAENFGLTSDPTKAAADNYIYKASVWSLFLNGGASSIDTRGGQALIWRMYDGFTTPMLKAFLQPGTVVVSADNKTLTYDGAFHDSDIAVPVGVDTSKILVTGGARNAGQYTTSAYSTQQGYDLIVTGGTLTITPKAVTVTYTANSGSSIYGNAIGSLGGSYSAADLVNGDTLSGVASWTTAATSASGVGAYAVTGAGLTASANYTLTSTQAAGNARALSITPRALTVTYTANGASSIYGDAPTGLGGTHASNGLVNGDALSGVASWTTAAISASGVGAYSVTGSGLTASTNYTLTSAQATGNARALSITPRALTVTYTANGASSIYGDAPTGLGGTHASNGLVNGDTLSGVASWTTAATSASGVGAYAVTGSGLTASANYTLTSAQATGNAKALSITPRALTVTYTANGASSVYGDAIGLLGGTYAGDNLVNGDTLSGVASWTTAATSASGVGSYAITGLGLTASANYTLTSTQAAGNARALSITPRALTVTYTANNASSIYGDAPTGLGGTHASNGLVNGDTLSGLASWATSATSASGVGSYAITGSGLTASANYALTSTQAADNARALSITPRALTVTADAATRVYGEANPALTWTVGGRGLVNGDTLSGALATAADGAASVGDHAITQGALRASANYAMTFVEGLLSVTPAPNSDPSSRILPVAAFHRQESVTGGVDLLSPVIRTAFSTAEITNELGASSQDWSGTSANGCQQQGDDGGATCSAGSGS